MSGRLVRCSARYSRLGSSPSTSPVLSIGQRGTRVSRMFFVALAALSGLIWGVGDFSGGKATQRAAVLPVVWMSKLVSLPLLVDLSGRDVRAGDGHRPGLGGSGRCRRRRRLGVVLPRARGGRDDGRRSGHWRHLGRNSGRRRTRRRRASLSVTTCRRRLRSAGHRAGQPRTTSSPDSTRWSPGDSSSQRLALASVSRCSSSCSRSQAGQPAAQRACGRSPVLKSAH